jgi:hypothetical protein
MAMDRFLIAPFDKESGLQTNVEPFMIPDTSFAQLTNAYVWRGRVRKRFGSTWLGNNQLSSRLRVKIGTTVPGAGVQTFTVPTSGIAPDPIIPIITPAVGQMFSIGAFVFTIQVLGSPAPTASTGSATATFNATTGDFIVTPVIFPAAEDVYYYPALPVMGLQTFEGAAINYEPIIGFDTKFAYQYTGGGWERLNTELVTGQATWNGSDSDFFWTCTWLGTDAYTKLFFVTNFNELEPYSMRYYDNTMWRRFLPPIASETYMFGARILVPFKNRLVAFNTWEGTAFPGTNYSNRCRYSQIGNTVPPAPVALGVTNGAGVLAGNYAAHVPYKLGTMFTVGSETFMVNDVSAGAHVMPSTTGVAAVHTFDATTGAYSFAGAAHNAQVYIYYGGATPTAIVNTEWRQDVPGHGNAIDCPTTEQIISVEFIKDRLIVFFERSTWELVYLGNQAYPFGWQQINTELGAESTFSTVPFDKVAISVGNVGIMACNGANVERIDDAIPSTVFAIHNTNDGIKRVYGVRDYTNEMLYWTMPDNTRDAAHVYPNRILVFNYKTGTWAIFIDSITCFGYYYNFAGVTWDSTTITWDSLVTWDSGSLDAQAKHVIAGNQQGYTFMINPDEPTNAQVLQITNLASGVYAVTLTSYDHNLQAGEYIYLDDLVGDIISNVYLLNGKIFYIESITQHTITIDTSTLGVSVFGGYAGNGTISRVSAIDIKTKEFNFYMDKGRNACISKVDFLVERTDNGQIDIDYYVSSNSDSISSFSDPAVLVSDGSLETYPYIGVTAERHATRLWHPMYITAEGQCIQLHFYMDYPNMISNLVRKSQFVLHAMVFHAMPSSINLR